MRGLAGFCRILVAALFALPLGAASQSRPLVPFEVVDGRTIPRPLTDRPGDPERGRALAMDRSKGNCITCHQMPVQADFQGDFGPSLEDVGARYEPGELRLRLVDSKQINPESNMPSFYRVAGLNGVRRNFVGRPILEAQEVEDILAFLLTIK